ncbi:hypothetical protein NL676_029592 [Syzygium grande]|nr:hypothetical protein NL676_029592 [Syzygium grande]
MVAPLLLEAWPRQPLKLEELRLLREEARVVIDWTDFELEQPPWSATTTKLLKVQVAMGSERRALEEL